RYAGHPVRPEVRWMHESHKEAIDTTPLTARGAYEGVQQMRTLVLLVVITLTGVAAAAGNAFNPVFDDSNFNYFMGTCGRAVERTAYYNLAIIDGVVTAQVLDTRSPG